ncbi:hypothetical protein ACM66B_001239 [Microbotryomycetes sp. NB124-2]
MPARYQHEDHANEAIALLLGHDSTATERHTAQHWLNLRDMGQNYVTLLRHTTAGASDAKTAELTLLNVVKHHSLDAYRDELTHRSFQQHQSTSHDAHMLERCRTHLTTARRWIDQLGGPVNSGHALARLDKLAPPPQAGRDSLIWADYRQRLCQLWTTTFIKFVVWAHIDKRDPLFERVATASDANLTFEYRPHDVALSDSFDETKSTNHELLGTICRAISILHSIPRSRKDDKSKRARQSQPHQAHETATEPALLRKELQSRLVRCISTSSSNARGTGFTKMLAKVATLLDAEIVDLYLPRRQVLVSLELISHVCLSTTSNPRLGLVSRLMSVLDKVTKAGIPVTNELVQQALDEWVNLATVESAPPGHHQYQILPRFRITLDSSSSSSSSASAPVLQERRRQQKQTYSRNLFGSSIHLEIVSSPQLSTLLNFQSLIVFEQCFEIILGLASCYEFVCRVWTMMRREQGERTSEVSSTTRTMMRINELVKGLITYFGDVAQVAQFELVALLTKTKKIGEDLEQQDEDDDVSDQDNEEDYDFDSEENCDSSLSSWSSSHSSSSATSFKSRPRTDDKQRLAYDYQTLTTTFTKYVNFLERGFFLSTTVDDNDNYDKDDNELHSSLSKFVMNVTILCKRYISSSSKSSWIHEFDQTLDTQVDEVCTVFEMRLSRLLQLKRKEIVLEEMDEKMVWLYRSLENLVLSL